MQTAGPITVQPRRCSWSVAQSSPDCSANIPSLIDLDHGDLKFNTDFRSVYGTVLDQWLKAPSQVVLGRKFPALSIV